MSATSIHLCFSLRERPLHESLCVNSMVEVLVSLGSFVWNLHAPSLSLFQESLEWPHVELVTRLKW